MRETERKTKETKLEKGEKLVAYWEYPEVFTTMDKLLKPYGLKIRRRTRHYEWGDRVAVKVELLK